MNSGTYGKIKSALILILCMILLSGCTSTRARIEEERRQKAEGTFETQSANNMAVVDAVNGGIAAEAEEEEADSAAVADAVGDAEAEALNEPEPVEEPKPDPLPKYRELLEINPYIAGWLKVDDSVIDDPVVYTPLSQNYFLHRDIDGSEASKGTLFIAINWQDNYHNTLIYGHNMKDGTGFGSLAKFADESYGKSHHTLHFDTLYEERDYELFAAFYSQIDEEELETEEDREQADAAIEADGVARKEEERRAEAEESGLEPEEIEPVEPAELTLADLNLYFDMGDVDIYRQEKDEDNGRFRYYYYTDLSDKDDFDYYVQNVKERAIYDTGIEAEWGDDLITLSTCSYQVKNGRFVVVGIRKH